MINSIQNHFLKISRMIENIPTFLQTGTITRISGMKLEAVGLNVPLNTLCSILISPTYSIQAEVIGFSDDITYLMAMDHVDGLRPGTPITTQAKKRQAQVGNSLLGRVIDANGKPIDHRGDIVSNEYYPLISHPINPLKRKKVKEVLDVGIKAINTLLTVGKGQRIGIFASSGVGKSVLLGMMTRYTRADVVVVGLIGERGREVKEFIEDNLGESGLLKSVVVASPADTSPLLRANGAMLATSIAEYFRDQGLDVLLIVDSLTRYAQAQREIALSAGELPTTKGFSPSVFAKISQLTERSGNGMESQGSITAFYTVLVDANEVHDPIADHVRSVLDGHIVLSPQLAEMGHYPAIDIEKSISRVMFSLVDHHHMMMVNKFKKSYSTYLQNKELINVGLYQPGTDKSIDEAIKNKDAYENFLKQGINECNDFKESIEQFKLITQQSVIL